MLRVGDICMISKNSKYSTRGMIVRVLLIGSLDPISGGPLIEVRVLSPGGFYNAKLLFESESLDLVYSPGAIADFLC